MKTKSLKGKTAWVTGGKRIGQVIIRSLAEEGANIVVSYRSSEKEAHEAIKHIKNTGVAHMIVQCDVSSRESVTEALKVIGSKFKSLDVLILMASVFKPVKLEKITKQDWDQNFYVHVEGTFWPIQASLSMMPKGAHIITISDRTSIGKIYPGYLPYVVTKSAVAVMTRALAPELGARGIFINSIAPGPILKPDDISAKEWQKIRSQSIINFPVTDLEAEEEFAQTVLRLAKVRSSGAVYPLDLGHL